MAFNAGYIGTFLSGGATGAGNTDPDVSLGGVLTSQRVISQSATTTISGVTIIEAVGNVTGNGTLAYVASGNLITWADSGDTAGTAVNIGTNGTYKLDSATAGYIIITVVTASLPGDTTDSSVTIVTEINKIFDDILAAESWSGDIEYRCMFFKNEHPTETAFGFKFWIDSQAIGADDIEVGASVGGVGNGTANAAEIITNEDTAPGGGEVTFGTAPDIDNAIIVGNIPPSDCIAVWIKRSVPATTITEELNDTFALGFAAYG